MKRDQIIYAVLSTLMVGLGQIFKGEGEKAIKFILLIYFFVPAAIYFSLLMSGGLFLMVFGIGTLFTIIFWVYNIVDAYQFHPRRQR